MSKIVGALKEAAGTLTGDLILKQEGEIERRGLEVIDHPDSVGDKVERVLSSAHHDWVHGMPRFPSQ